MTKKIESLTPEQESDLVAFRSEWLGIGTSTEPADRPRAERAIAAMYTRIGETQPRFLWVESPATAAMAVANFQRDGNSLGESLRNSLRESLRESLRNSLWESLGNSLRSSFFGQHESHWVAFYIFGRKIGVKYKCESNRDLELWSEICRSCGWFNAWKGLAICSERPSAQLLNDRGVGHCDNGPAIAFRDGWKVWMLNGVRVDEQIVMCPETQTAEQIHGERNAEIKRIRIERFGWPKYLEAIKATVVDRRRNDVEGTREALMRTPDGMVILVCACPSTSRTYCLEVDPQVTSCVGAQNYLWSGSRLLANRPINLIGRT